MKLFFLFLISFIFSLGLTPLIRKLALKFKIVDYPGEKKRKIHKKPTPLLGGLAIFLCFFIVLFFLTKTNYWPQGNILNKQLWGLFIAGAVLMVGGFLDDKYKLKPGQQIIWPILACLIIIFSGIGIEFINNPFGEGYLYFNKIKIEILTLNGVPYYFTPWSDLITFFWLMILMYATKLLDGLDGLVSGVTVIGALIMAGFCLLTTFFQLDVGMMLLILAGASLGFLFFNRHPAKIFLGEGGSLFAGFILGVLAIISGSKIATAFLILGLAVIDLISVVAQRVLIDHHSPFQGDQRHFHFRLLKAGLSHKKAVIIYWLFALSFGLVALFLQTQGKIIALLILILIGIGLIVFFSFKDNQIEKEKNKIKEQ